MAVLTLEFMPIARQETTTPLAMQPLDRVASPCRGRPRPLEGFQGFDWTIVSTVDGTVMPSSGMPARLTVVVRTNGAVKWS